MWHWDQGHLAYFQFDSLRQISSYVTKRDFKTADKQMLELETGLPFAAPETHNPWRQYARVLKLCMLVSEVGDSAQPTPVAQLLSVPGLVTCDEYLHFLIRAFTEPSPALADWSPDSPSRYPLLFALKYLLAKCSIAREPICTFDEIIGAYRHTGFSGDENDAAFITAVGQHQRYAAIGRGVSDNLRRQARESLKVISQISYLHLEDANIVVSLDPADAQAVFAEMTPVGGPKAIDRDAELRRLAELFRNGANEDFYDYPNTVVNDAVQSGFIEGTKVKRTHITIERNQELRRAFFVAHPSPLCDLCVLETARTYPWAVRVLDLHHLLPLSSGTRVEQNGTTFEDLVPVCPTCHRAIHRFYDLWLNENDLADFPTERHARQVYTDLKSTFGGAIHV